MERTQRQRRSKTEGHDGCRMIDDGRWTLSAGIPDASVTLLDQFVGQEHIVGSGTALRTAIERDALSSVIFSGPPGTGKTTLARVIAETTKATSCRSMRSLSGVKELKEVCTEAARMQSTFKQRDGAVHR
jgi:MoxR-like ATPase